MSALIAQLTTWKQELSQEFERFTLLWRYQHPSPPFALWWRLVLKRVVDTLGAAVLLAVFSPVMLVLAILVKLDSDGPVLFSQERLGRFGEPFKMYKFRSMIPDAEAATGPVWASPAHDPRVTRLGRFLRRSHLDELPQLLNVVTGDMSLVGPRPERMCFVKALERAVPCYDHRLYVKPGMTGLAQVHYRYDQTVDDVKKKLRFDLLYVRHMCLMLDVKILAWTLMVVFTGRGIR
jgi:lipopolysaccharide/colanic/teichoic acid biosynthesis glycosyltransferase